MTYGSPEARRAYKRKYAQDNREHIAAYKRKWRAEHPDLLREQGRRSRARRAEGIHVIYFHRFAPGELAALYEAQAGRCAICDRSAPMRGPGCLQVDHDHGTGERRGLICKPCNTALHIVDRVGPTWLLRALAYIGDPPLQRMRKATAASGGTAAVREKDE